MEANNKLTEYERKRIENIRRNDEKLAALKILSKASQLSASTKRRRGRPSKSSKVSPEEKKKSKSESRIVIRQPRRSLRSRGMQPDSTGLDGETFKMPPSRRSSPVNGQLRMSDVYSGRTGSDRPLIATILKLHGEFVSLIKNEIDRCEQSDDDILDTSLKRKSSFECSIEKKKKEVENCVDLSSLNLKPENIAQLMPQRITVLKFLPSYDVKMIAAANNKGNVAFWKLDSPVDEEGDGIYLYHPHKASVSAILFQQSCLSKIFTSSYDGSLRMMNAEKRVFDLIYSSDYAIFSMSQRPNDMNGLYFGKGDGGLSILDERMGKLSSEWMLHQDRINTIDFNSQNPNIMATSSMDGTACLWDLRSVNTDKPNCLNTVKHESAVHSAYFSPSGSFLATTSLDDTVGIFDCANFEDESQICHDNQTGIWISSFKRSIWGWDDSYIFIGNMKRGVDVICRSQQRAILTLESPYMSAVPCRFDVHPYNIGMLAGGTGGGQVYVWTSS